MAIRKTSDLVDRYYALTLRAGNRRALTLLLKEGQITDTDRIKAIAIPTFILWGRLDRHVLFSDAERFHSDIAGSQLIIFDGLGHVPHEEDPATTVKPVQAFLGRLEVANVRSTCAKAPLLEACRELGLDPAQLPGPKNRA